MRVKYNEVWHHLVCVCVCVSGKHQMFIKVSHLVVIQCSLGIEILNFPDRVESKRSVGSGRKTHGDKICLPGSREHRHL